MKKPISTTLVLSLITGLVVGLVLSASLSWLHVIWGPRPFHHLPALFVIIILAAFTWRSGDITTHIPAFPRWFVFLTLTSIIPLSWIVDVLSMHLAFASNDASILQFLLLMLVNLVLAPSALVISWFLRTETKIVNRPGSFLLGVSIGIISGIFLIESTLFSPIVIIVITLFSSILTLFFRPQQASRDSISPRMRKESGKALKWIVPFHKYVAEFIIPLATFAVVFWIGKFYIALRVIHLWTPFHDGLMIGFFLTAVGLGLFVSRLFSDGSKNAIPLLIGLCIIPAGIVGTLIAFDKVLYPALFIAYFENQSTSFLFLATLASVFLPTAFGLGLVLSTRYLSNSRNSGTIALNIGLSAVLALVAVLFLSTIPLTTAIFLPLLIVLFCLAVIPFIMKRFILVGVSAIVIALTLGALLSTRIHTSHRMLDRSRFTISKAHSSGVDTWFLVQNRNYDDPFFAIQVGASPALTQTSESARGILRKMGLYTLAFSPNKPRILQIGLGSGIPANEFLRISPRSINIVEPEKAIIDFGKKIAAHFSQSWTTLQPSFHLENPLAYLKRYSGESYSLVVSFEPFAGAYFDHRFFTSSFYKSIKSTLSENGVFIQWLPLSMVSPDDLRSILATFSESFPGVTAWLPDVEPDLATLALVGTRDDSMPDLRLDLFRDSTQIQAFRQSSIEGPERLLASHVLSSMDVSKLTNTASTRSFWGPQLQGLSNYQTSWGAINVRDLLETRSSPPDLNMHSDVTERALDLWQRYPVLSQFYHDLRKNPTAQTIAALESIYSIDTTDLVLKNAYAQSLLLVGASFVANEAYTSAKPLLIRATKLGLNSMYINRLLMLTAYNIGDLEAGNRFANRVLAVNMHHAGIFDNAATLFSNDGKIENAIINHQRAIAADTTNINLYCSLAATLYNAGRKWEALRALEDGIIRANNPALAYYYKGLFYQDSGKYRQALLSYEEYLFLAQPNAPFIERAETAVETLRRVLL